ncbi:MAG: DHH family phosphoesterase [Candidatus Buchananbacteria bacterium]|nr:DHH family phosphoesterase [Candidatus Buchananbacteria bacterium]
MSISLFGPKIQSALAESTNVLLVIHQQPDADALGSLIAITDWLDQLNKNHTGYCLGTSLAECLFVDQTRQLIDRPDLINHQKFDTVLVLDCGDLKYAGLQDWMTQINYQPQIINIDHHASNQYFGHINLVDSNAASTTEIIYQLFKFLKIKFSAPTASALLAGIINDTYGFTNPNTSAKSLDITSQLIKAGAKLGKVSDSILKNKSLADLQLWGTILTRLSHNPNLNIATTIIAGQDIQNDRQNLEVTEGIANFLNNLSGVDAAMILKQEGPDLIKGSLRTNSDLIDVSALAKVFGGGGHKKAAGFRIKGKLIQTEQGHWQIM